MAFFDRTVVGVVGDVRVRELERGSEPQVYLPAPQLPEFGVIGSPPKDPDDVAAGHTADCLAGRPPTTHIERLAAR